MVRAVRAAHSPRRASLPLHGGCQCGHIRYRIAGAPLVLYACHCTECQRQSASAFGLSMAVQRDALTVPWDLCQTWSRRGASGREVVCRCCPRCGARLFHEPRRNPAIVNVKPGSLDDRDWIRPIGHLWTSSKQPWVPIPPESLEYSAQPDDFSALFEAWEAVSAEIFANEPTESGFPSQ